MNQERPHYIILSVCYFSFLNAFLASRESSFRFFSSLQLIYYMPLVAPFFNVVKDLYFHVPLDHSISEARAVCVWGGGISRSASETDDRFYLGLRKEMSEVV